MATIEFKTFADLSKSDFSGQVRVSKDTDGKFRSFGVSYQGRMVWTADEHWYKAWIAGTVIAGSIILKEEQLMTTKKDDQGNPVIENGRKVYIPVEGQTNLVMVALKTKEQLQNEDDLEVWDKTRVYDKKDRLLKAYNNYNETAKKAAEAAVLTPEQQTKLDAMMAELGF